MRPPFAVVGEAIRKPCPASSPAHRNRMTQDVDFLIIGAGAAGIGAARRLCSLGASPRSGGGGPCRRAGRNVPCRRPCARPRLRLAPFGRAQTPGPGSPRMRALPSTVAPRPGDGSTATSAFRPPTTPRHPRRWLDGRNGSTTCRPRATARAMRCGRAIRGTTSSRRGRVHQRRSAPNGFRSPIISPTTRPPRTRTGAFPPDTGGLGRPQPASAVADHRARASRPARTSITIGRDRVTVPRTDGTVRARARHPHRFDRGLAAARSRCRPRSTRGRMRRPVCRSVATRRSSSRSSATRRSRTKRMWSARLAAARPAATTFARSGRRSGRVLPRRRRGRGPRRWAGAGFDFALAELSGLFGADIRRCLRPLKATQWSGLP